VTTRPFVLANRRQRISVALLATSVATLLTNPLYAQSVARDTSGRGVTVTPNGSISVPSRRRFLIGVSVSGTPVLGPDGKFRFRDYPVVAVVTPGSPGELAGVRAGDFILSENDRDAREGRLFATDTLGATYRVRVKRGDEILEFILTSVKMPPSAVPPRG
jgi:S1-C subfamily serine protease